MGSMASSLRMVFMGQGGAEKGHDPISGEPVDGAFALVDFIHQDFKAAIHDFMNILRIQVLTVSPALVHEPGQAQVTIPRCRLSPISFVNSNAFLK